VRAIITAGALIGLGLTALGIGTRYQSFTYRDADKGEIVWLRFRDLDSSLMMITVLLVICTIVGLALAFIGLAYHHHRRHHEMLRDHGRLPTTPTGSAV